MPSWNGGDRERNPQLLGAVLNFWFTPTDPSTLGFIRVVTGLLVLYTHLAYCYDLTGFFGKNAWYDLASIDRERKEYPHVAPPLNGWDDRVFSARLPDPPHRKRAFLNWMRSVTADSNARERGLKLLRDLQATNDGQTFRPWWVTSSNCGPTRPFARHTSMRSLRNRCGIRSTSRRFLPS